MLDAAEIFNFRQRLLTWYRQQRRDLPWRRTKDPYRVWLSEIMLQQTRVNAAVPYYERFLTRFPDIGSLAAASEPDLLAAWAGLGYYNRARNLQKAAQTIAAAGRFPESYEEILRLPGVGEYTAAAISSICFGLPHAVVDGNVFRVISRVLDDHTNIALSRSRQHFAILADALLAQESAGDFNQAMMELGATICLPQNPQCLLCPVDQLCRARAKGNQASLPVKSPSPKSTIEERTLFWIEEGNRLLLWQRSADSRLMPGFWELPEEQQLPQAILHEPLGSFKHGITTHDYRFTIVAAELPIGKTNTCRWVTLDQLTALPLSTIVVKAMRAVERATRSRRAVHGRARAAVEFGR